MRKARKSIASFKLREGMAVGAKVTLRGARMYVPRPAGFGRAPAHPRLAVSTGSFDGRGNYSLGVREQIIFPEIDYDSVG